ncbi:MAG: hypothetical protein KC621_13160 [Myxococcales bacterium]|nr:hypothetical protein [Myxococcales bacterium]
MTGWPLWGLTACLSPRDLVPPTVVDDPALPQATITVAGRERSIHLVELGDPEAPVLMITHGSASDIRPYEALEALADDWRVVFWDLRGNGLSERVPADELDPEDMAEEMDAVRRLVSPNAPTILMGHSCDLGAMDLMMVGSWPFHAALGVGYRW